MASQPEREDEAHPEMRRLPQRARGQQRVAAILDAAEQLYAEAGYEPATTNDIAARAATSIGSLYQFFPNKEAILHAVAARYREGMLAVYDQFLTPDTSGLSLADLVERLIMAVVEYGGAHLGLSRVLLQGQANPEVATAAHILEREVISRLDRLLEARAPWLSDEARVLYAHVGLTAFNALLSLAITEKHAGRAEHALQVIGQARVLLVAYFETVAGR